MIVQHNQDDSVNVVIFGHTLQIKSDVDDPERVQKIAKYVHDIMTQINEDNPGRSVVDTAMLTAMNLTNALLYQQTENINLSSTIEDFSSRLMDYFNEEMKNN